MPHLEAGPIFEGQLVCALLASADGKRGGQRLCNTFTLRAAERNEIYRHIHILLEDVDDNKG